MAERDTEYEDHVISSKLKGMGLLSREFELSKICCTCSHIYSAGAHTCAAFPRGIPEEIWSGRNKHTSPYPGDHGIQYSPFENSDPA